MVAKEISRLDGPTIYTIHSSVSFVDALAAGVVEQYGLTPARLSQVRILVPTRRSARALLEAFVRHNQGAAMLLPRVSPIGDIDEDEETFAEATDEFLLDVADRPEILPAVSNHERHFMLTRLILQASQAEGFVIAGEAQALELAYELAGLLDQVHREGGDFANLEDLVPDRYAAHWQQTLEFLQIITEHWPGILAERNLIDGMDRRNQLMASLAFHWQASRPETPVLVAGSTGSIPATAGLMSVIARLPNGAIVLPGLDLDVTDAVWDAMDVSHPQWGMKNLLEGIKASRHEVEAWPLKDATAPEAGRTRILSAAMTPVSLTGDWAERHEVDRNDLKDIHLLEASGAREEAGAISLMMREVTESSDKSCALVTPDRDLARRVGAELRRWGLDVDDSAGEPLSSTLTGTLLRLTVRVVAERYAPVPLLELLKHPLVALGQERVQLLTAARRIERMALRGPRRSWGLDALADMMADEPALRDVIESLREALGPLEAEFAKSETSLAALMSAHIECAESLARGPEQKGADRLWAGDGGDAAASLLAEIIAAADTFPALSPPAYPSLFNSLIHRAVVRPNYGMHPKLSIWGPMEARLQSADRVILAGLNEGSWPQLPSVSPWMSRPMQADFGLSVPERRIGLSAHDFVQAAARSEVFLSRSTKVEGTLTISSRWLQRLQTYLAAAGQSLGEERGQAYLSWYRGLDLPADVLPADRPRPKPPVSARPTHLSVTEIETLIRDPYAIYAKHVLNLRALAPIDDDPGAAERGTVVHRAMEEFANRYPDTLPEDAMAALEEVGRDVFDRFVDNASVRAFWWPRFLRAGAWFVDYERDRRRITHLEATEARGEIDFPVGDAMFRLTCSADRIDAHENGLFDIIDYKTGTSPTDAQVTTGLSPQLPLEAAILKAGGFEGISASNIGELIYIELRGGREAGKARSIQADTNALATEQLQNLVGLLNEYNDPETPYLSRVAPFSDRYAGDYDHLARLAEQFSGRDGTS